MQPFPSSGTWSAGAVLKEKPFIRLGNLIFISINFNLEGGGGGRGGYATGWTRQFNSELFYNTLSKTVNTESTAFHKRPQSTLKAQYLYITQITTNTISVRAVLSDPQCSTSVARLQSSVKLRVLEGEGWRIVAENDFDTVRICLQVQREAIYQYSFSIQTVGRPHDDRSSVLSKNRQMSRIFTPSCVILNRNRPECPIRAAIASGIIIIIITIITSLLLSVLPPFDKGYSCLCPRHATKALGGGQWLSPLPGCFTIWERTRYP
jgi:hypothetical protein